MWMQIFCFVLAALVLTVSAITLGEHPTTDTTEEPPVFISPNNQNVQLIDLAMANLYEMINLQNWMSLIGNQIRSN